MPANNVGRVGIDTGGPQEWFRALPLVTRVWFGSSLLVTLCGNLQIINVRNLIFAWEPLKNNFEIWRLVTPFLYMGPFQFNTLISLYILMDYSKRYESSSGYNTGAGGGTADYVFALIFAATFIFITYPFLTGYLAPIFGTNMTYFVLYIWSKRYPDVQVSLFGFPIPALWLPFALLVLKVFMGAPFTDLIQGLVVGHLYYYLVDIVPLIYGKDFLHTPQFLIDYFGIGAYTPQPSQQQRQPARQPDRTTNNETTFPAFGRTAPPRDAQQLNTGGNTNTNNRYNWGGSGRVLGTD